MRAETVFDGSTLTCGGSTMIGGWVGAADGGGVSADGDADSPGVGIAAGDAAGTGVPVGDGIAAGSELSAGAGVVTSGGGVGGAGSPLVAGDAGSLGAAEGGADWSGAGEGAVLGAAGGGADGVPCAHAATATAHTNARLENGARTRRKRLLIGVRFYAIFCAAGSRETADASSVL